MLSPTPEAIRYIPESLLGGVWRETEKLLDFTRQAATGDEIDQGRIPCCRRSEGIWGRTWRRCRRSGSTSVGRTPPSVPPGRRPQRRRGAQRPLPRPRRRGASGAQGPRRHQQGAAAELALEGYDANKAQIRALRGSRRRDAGVQLGGPGGSVEAVIGSRGLSRRQRSHISALRIGWLSAIRAPMRVP